jgi:predicted lipid-binding transport protein (Tim44 family)
MTRNNNSGCGGIIVLLLIAGLIGSQAEKCNKKEDTYNSLPPSYSYTPPQRDSTTPITEPAKQTVRKKKKKKKGNMAAQQNTIAAPDNYYPAPRSQPRKKRNYYGTGGCLAGQCHGITQKGSRCRRNTTNCSGYCWQH